MEIIIPYSPRKNQKECHTAIEGVRFSVIVAHRGFGKTVLAVNHLIKKALQNVGFYGFVAPYRKQAKEIAWGHFKQYTAPIPARGINESELTISLPTGGKIGLYGADDPDSLRGLHWDGVVLDEVSQMKSDVWGEIIRPGLSAKKGFSVFIGTPKGQNLFYELYQQGVRSPDWFTGFYPVTVTDIFDQRELNLARESMSESQYAQEFLCDFTAAISDTLIRLDVVESASQRVYGESVYYRLPKVMGVDIARFGNDMSVITIRQGSVVYPQIKLRDMHNETTALAGRIGQEIRNHTPLSVFVDAGYNPGVIDLLRGWGYTITEVNFGGKADNPEYYLNRRAEMWKKMKDWLETGSIPNDPMLKSSLIAPTYDFQGKMGSMKLESKESMKERGIQSPDCGDSLALTFAYPVHETRVEERKYQPEAEKLLYDYDPFEEVRA